MTRQRRNRGRTAEELAVRFLEENGYTILERNYKCRSGEIDVVACEGETICFVEVKSRGSDDYGAPAAGIAKAQMRRIVDAALVYLGRKNAGGADCRFDVVSVLAEGGDAEPEIELFRGAFRPTVRLP